MSIFKRVIAFALTFAMAAFLAACAGGDSSTASVSSQDTASYRQPYVAEGETAEFVDTDGDFDYETVAWDGPEGYVIVIPAGDAEARETAEYLQKYYSDVHNVTLQIVTDATAEQEKEIIIGETGRSQSETGLAAADIKVSIKDSKLVFGGGHYVTVEAGVKRFTRLLPNVNEAFVFSLTTDFTVTPDVAGLEDYGYVWGDEFEDWYDIDFAKWNFRLGMSGSATAIVSTDRDVIDVSDGRLKIHAINYFDVSDPTVEFKMPYSTATNNTMNFLYGYAEIRARVPFFKGAWPSFWGGSGTGVVERNPLWHAEVDVFEIFGTEDTVVPNIHKWYDGYDYGGIYNVDSRHTQYTSETYPKKSYVFSQSENLDNEYHTYGYEWTPTEMNFFVDGEKYCTMDIINSWDLEEDMSMFQEPQYSQFNCHVFVEEATFTPNLIYENVDLLPAQYYIDYYRLYQKDDGRSKIWVDTSNKDSAPQNRDKEIKIDE